MSKNDVVIVNPLTKDHQLCEAEKISLYHLEYFLPDYDKYFLCPMDSHFKYQGIPNKKFDNSYFGSLIAHNMLCLSEDLYNSFTDYKYLLMYHLDALVFRRDLEKWLAMDYDYIAPPWITGPDLPWLKKEGVGNGGLSLRKIETFRKLLNSNIPMETFFEKLKVIYRSKSVTDFTKNFLNLLTWFYPPKNRIKKHIEKFICKEGGNDDRFLVKYRNKYYPAFKVPSVETALKFGFEANPRICYERNNHNLPFGCHAWEKYDREFWEPFLLNKDETPNPG